MTRRAVYPVSLAAPATGTPYTTREIMRGFFETVNLLDTCISRRRLAKIARRGKFQDRHTHSPPSGQRVRPPGCGRDGDVHFEQVVTSARRQQRAHQHARLWQTSVLAAIRPAGLGSRPLSWGRIPRKRNCSAPSRRVAGLTSRPPRFRRDDGQGARRLCVGALAGAGFVGGQLAVPSSQQRCNGASTWRRTARVIRKA